MISNTGPLIALAKVAELRLLKVMFGSVVVPKTVARELMAKPGPETELLDAALADFIAVTDSPPVPPAAMLVLKDLDAGEREAITLALLRKEPLLIDDKAGRAAARVLDIPVTGTVGLVLAAKDAGFIPRVLPLLEQMREHGYWLSEALFVQALRLSREDR